MIQRLNVLVASLALLFAPCTAAAQSNDEIFLRANWFVRNCDEGDWRLACYSYILGYYQGSQTRTRTVCLPKGVDTGQLIAIALAYMKSHPEKGHLLGMILADEAWEAAFPCG